MAKAPLAGIRILDFGQILAAPFCTRMLADLGADVVKVETEARLDRLGAVKLGPEYKGRRDRTPSFLNVNRNKRSILLNVKMPEGRAIARRLAAVSDIVIENFAAGVMARLGLDYTDLQPDNPRLIYISMSGYGHDGPRKDWTSMNSNLQAYTGLMMVTGNQGDPPVSVSNSWNDYMGGLTATFALLQALARREVTGVGMNLDLAQFESSVSTLGPLLLASAINGQAPPRMGNRSTSAAPQGCYQCAGKDQWCVISVQSDEQWRDLVNVSGLKELGDARFASLPGRLRHHDEIDAAIEKWTSDLSKEEIESRLCAAGVPAEPMRRINEVMELPEAKRVFHPMEDPPGLSTPMTALPFRFSSIEPVPMAPAAAPGEHTEEVLREWLGLDPAETKRLESDGVLV